MTAMDLSTDSPRNESRAGRGILRFRRPSPKPGRLQFIDAFRGWAVLVMVETHVANSMLRPELMHGAAYKVLNFINGLVAPSFLFAAGLTFAIATRKKINDYLSFRPALVKQLLRLGLLFVIGYGLHIPKFEYHHLRYDAGVQAWHTFFQVDVLQCIAASLLLLMVLLFAVRTERRMYISAGLLSIGMVFATPLIWEVDFWHILPIPLAEYFNGLHASLFPLFPWAAFVLTGTLAGYYYLEAAHGMGGGNVAAAMRRFSLIALAIVAVSFALHPLAASVYPSYDYWKTSPSFFLLRLGLVMLICAGLFFWEKWRSISSSSVITISGRESLLVYTVHLMILYGNFKGPHLVDRVGHQFGYLEVFGLSAVLIVLMILLAVVWDFLKAQHRWIRRTIEAAVVTGFAVVFFFGL